MNRNLPSSPSIRGKFPPPWRVRETVSGCAIEDATGRNLAWVYGCEGLRRTVLNDALTVAEARSVAKAIASLPELVEAAEKVGR